jgi:serine protease AprX
MRRALMGCMLALAITAAPAIPIVAAPRAPHAGTGGRAVLADRDGDRVDDGLERRLRRAVPGSRHSVVVATDGSIGLAVARRTVGAFPVSRTLGIIDGFAARMTGGQVRALSAVSGVLRIDHDAVVRATMDAARADYGVDTARAVFGAAGAGVTVCILDTGVDPSHEQLDSKDITWNDFTGDSTTPYDDHGHGTHVASIAVGDGTGGPSAARFGGVAPLAALWAGKVLDAQGAGDESGIIAAIDWCAADPSVDVISMSLGSEVPSDGTDVMSIAANNAVAEGKVVVAAAGNWGDVPDSISSPGAASDVIAVGAVSAWSAAPGALNHTEGIYLAPFSSRGGPTFAGDTKPDVVAPGINIMAADADTATGYVQQDGTSMAAPFAAGSVALALQSSPGWTPAQVQAAVEGTAEDLGPAGKDPEWGAGLIDVHALVALAAGSTGETAFPTLAHLSGTVTGDGPWTHSFEIAAGDLGVPIAATIVLDGTGDLFFFPGVGWFGEWAPDLDARLLDPNGDEISLSECALRFECVTGRQETLHAMPTVAGTYEIQVWAFVEGEGGDFELDLSTGPAADDGSPPPPPPPPPTMHVGDLDRSSVWLSATRWRARVTIRVHDAEEAPLTGVVVTGRWGKNGSVTCTTNSGGACALTRELKKSRASIAFTVLGLSFGSFDYVAADNHDPDGDSNGTRIVVTRP